MVGMLLMLILKEQALSRVRGFLKQEDLIEKIAVFFYLFFSYHCVYAEGLWDTSAGRAFSTSPEGVLLFALLKLIGLFYALKSLHLLREYSAGRQTSCPPWRCMLKLTASVWLFYAAASMSIVYNSF
jgi:hypothetical protein